MLGIWNAVRSDASLLKDLNMISIMVTCKPTGMEAFIKFQVACDVLVCGCAMLYGGMYIYVHM